MSIFFNGFVKPNPAKVDSESQFAIIVIMYSDELHTGEAVFKEQTSLDFHREDILRYSKAQDNLDTVNKVNFLAIICNTSSLIGLCCKSSSRKVFN